MGESHGRDNGEYGGIGDIEDDGIEYIKDGKDRDEDESEGDGVMRVKMIMKIIVRMMI